ncbi:MAG: aminotransferase class III-fold pyridoxal phosphate-dependent enzyme [Bryobacterales bacterium]|nr:aminotransferase class III-fold pyridoxal phosphate-dependent enzyme [Bryobacterales bacterium]
MLETYQGGQRQLRPRRIHAAAPQWCTGHVGPPRLRRGPGCTGRTGKLAGYQHYGIVPDLSTWGKGISSSLPISCVIGRADVMDLHPAGSMTSTHTGNPLCAAAALANIELIEREGLRRTAARLGEVPPPRLRAMQAKHSLNRLRRRQRSAPPSPASNLHH